MCLFQIKCIQFQEQPRLGSRKKSSLELLAQEAFDAVERNESLEAIDKKIRTFLSEDSIIERTKNCKTYFEDFVTPLGSLAKVIFHAQLKNFLLSLEAHNMDYRTPQPSRQCPIGRNINCSLASFTCQSFPIIR